MNVIKYDDSILDFCLEKIERAIKKANDSLADPSTRMNEEQILKVVNTVIKKLEGYNSISVNDIHDFVEQSLVKHNKWLVSRAYIKYRDEKKKNKKFTPTESKFLALLNGTSELRGDNANKHIDDNGSIRDYAAGLLCKSIANKTLPKDIISAHNKGLIHYHDLDYSPVQPEHNCFGYSQKFITNYGIKKFGDFIDGDIVTVKDKNGEFREATVHTYGMQKLKNVTLSSRNGKIVNIICTANHRWLLNDGSETTNLSIGDKLIVNKTFDNKIEILTEDDAKYWCIGFCIGDGVSKNDKTYVRLCGNKNKYLEYFHKSKIFRDSNAYGDEMPYTKLFSKQDFLNGKSWKFLSAHQKALIFLGLYAADGKTQSASISSNDSRVIELIEECSGMANYFITSKKEEYHNTNYKENAYLCTFHFLMPQKDNYGWTVKNITTFAHNKDCKVYCVEEPVTHTFTLENGIITGNCGLINAEDMLQHNFAMGSTGIFPNDETPFRTICNLFAQINLIVSGRQYGGQTISWSHALPYIDLTRKMFRKEVIEDFAEEGITLSEESLNKKVERKLKKEIKEGVKIYQYQVLCHSSANGQTPFVSNNLCLREAQTEQEEKDFAILIEAILRRRIKGVQDPTGHYVSPLFPKLLYWTSDGLNISENDPYYYLTELAAECEIKRTQPDICSESECRRIKSGQIIPSMGCRSLLHPIWEDRKYDISEGFYYVEGASTYPYGTWVEKKSFENFENRTYETGYENGEVSINFRGNTGWLKEKTDEYVIISQPIVYGRFNQGVITVNTPHVALEAVKEFNDRYDNNTLNGDTLKDIFYRIFDDRLELCHKALLTRHESVKNIKSINSSMLWQYGVYGRLKDDETVGDLMEQHPLSASISLGYVGLYETCRALIGESNTSDNGRKLSKEILQFMNDKCAEWKAKEHLAFSIYGTPEESLTYKFSLANRKDFGIIKYITDKDYVVNSYHVDPRENIDAFTKLKIEGEYLALSPGGAVSYVETLDLTKNPAVILDIMKWMNHNILYAEFNRKIGICYECGYEGDIDLTKTDDGNFKFVCPNCGNTDDDKMDVTGRLCGYLGKINAGNTNKGRLDDIYNRVIHLDNFDTTVI